MLIINGMTKQLLCTKAGNSPDNKGKVLKQFDIPADDIVDWHKYRGGKILILRPKIDKLIFNYDFEGPMTSTHLVRKAVIDKAQKMIASKKKLLCGFKQVEDDKKTKKTWKSSHHYNFIFEHENSPSTVIIQLEAKKSGVSFFSCDCNPSKLGKGGMDDLKKLINTLFDNDVYAVTYETIFSTPKGIKRIDIAVDMLGVDASDLCGQYIYKGKELKGHVYESLTGRLETYYFVLPENDKAKCYWYNKQKEEEEKQSPKGSVTKAAKGGYLHTRFEYRILNSTKPVSNLHSLQNHLHKVNFQAMDYDAIKDGDFTYDLFLRYALHRTKEKALNLIPINLKNNYDDAYEKCMTNIWNPKKIWENGWSQELYSLGLIDKSKLPKKKSIVKLCT